MIEEHFCPNCGYWRPNIIERTGWCGFCTADAENKVPLVCQRCKRVMPVKLGETRPLCSRCRDWRTKNRLKSNEYRRTVVSKAKVVRKPHGNV